MRQRRTTTCSFVASVALFALTGPALAQRNNTVAAADGSVLPFPGAPSASIAAPRLQDSKHVRRVEPNHLRKDAPNVLIILLDDVGFGQASTFGGEVNTPTLSKLADQGVSYNAFHTTAICSPTRAALLTGRNHQRVGNGTIAERAVDWDGYTGVIPKSSATMAEVMRHYGYKTAAIGKWHNTPADQTTSMGPFDRWPTGHGFDYFYGFLAGETSQWEPRLVENTNQIEPPHSEKYHLSEDLAQRGIDWLRRHQAFAPDKPFLLYWAPGAGHGPHQIFKEWADKYKGKFDNGWDAYRERVFARQKQLGWIPADTKLTPRAASMPSWDSIPEAQRPFQRRLMEIFAGFVEHVDVQAGRVVDELERLGIRDNTIVIYIFGDNGASAEGQNGTISELLAQNGIPNTVEQQLAALDRIGGLDALGGPKTDSMYHAGWAWAGNTPFQHTKLVASHFGGTRNPMVISWPKGIKPDKTPRPQFHHVNDIAPTIYELVGIKPPKVVDGVAQDPIDGVSLAYTFNDPKAPPRKNLAVLRQQRQPRDVSGWLDRGDLRSAGAVVARRARPCRMGLGQGQVGALPDQQGFFRSQRSRREGAAALGAVAEGVRPAGQGQQGLSARRRHLASPASRGPDQDAVYELAVRCDHHADAGIHRARHRPREQHRHHRRRDRRQRLRRALCAGRRGRRASRSTWTRADLVYEYNMMIIERYIARSATKIAPGKHRIEVTTRLESAKPLSAAEVVVKVDGQEVGRTTVKRTVPAAFSASETFDVGVDLGSTVSTDYFDRRPFRFDGKIEKVDVKLD